MRPNRDHPTRKGCPHRRPDNSPLYAPRHGSDGQGNGQGEGSRAAAARATGAVTAVTAITVSGGRWVSAGGLALRHRGQQGLDQHGPLAVDPQRPLRAGVPAHSRSGAGRKHGAGVRAPTPVSRRHASRLRAITGVTVRAVDFDIGSRVVSDALARVGQGDAARATWRESVAAVAEAAPGPLWSSLAEVDPESDASAATA